MGTSKNNTMLNTLIDSKESFLEFFKAKYPVYHNSNVFFRDFQYAIQKFLEKKDYKVTYKEAEELVYLYSNYLEQQSLFQKVNNIGWRLNYPDFSSSVPYPKVI